MPNKNDVKHTFFPETAVGGYSRVDGTVEFYSRINALLRPNMTVLDFGAGRGSSLHEDPCTYRRELQRLQGKVSKVVGVDVDDAILSHTSLDARYVLDVGQPLPFEDESFDLIVSDHVFEHLDDPAGVSQELKRVLKPGGWLCARTPNKWGYVGIGARVVPQRLHNLVLGKLQKDIRVEEDVFPTLYRMNTRKTISEYFPENTFENYTYIINPEPAYFGNSKIFWWLAIKYFNICPYSLGTVLLLFLRKN